jgi:hypothetical protein
MNNSSFIILQTLHLEIIIQVVFAIQLSTIYELLHIWAVNHGYQDGIPTEHGLWTNYLQPKTISRSQIENPLKCTKP